MVVWIGLLIIDLKFKVKFIRSVLNRFLRSSLKILKFSLREFKKFKRLLSIRIK